MQKQYDDFSKMKIKEMCKNISDMTYTYINPETKKPTNVPSSHYEKILGKVKEELVSDITRKNFLNTMYIQLKAIKDEEPEYFRQALICLDINIKPNDLRVNEEIALKLTEEMLEEKIIIEKKDFHIIDSNIIDYFNEVKDSPDIQASIIKKSEEMEEYLEDENIFEMS